MKSQVSVITGASRGIGEAIALNLAAEGHSLAIFGRDNGKLKIVKNKLNDYGIESKSYTGDVANPEFVTESVDDVLKQFGRIDNLINNAGVGYFTTFVNSNLDQFKRQVDTNLYGIYNFSKACINHMIENREGTIVNISSLAGKNGFIGGTMYSATKHAVMGFTKSLLMEVRQYNIRVAAICPGSVSTEMILNTPIQPKDTSKILVPKDVADVVATLLKLPQNALLSEVEIRPTNPK